MSYGRIKLFFCIHPALHKNVSQGQMPKAKDTNPLDLVRIYCPDSSLVLTKNLTF